MKRILLRPQILLLGMNFILGGAIITFWMFGAEPWSPPSAMPLNAAVLVPFQIKQAVLDSNLLNAIIERPLFVAERRPVTEKTAGEVNATVDIFNDVKLVGILGQGAQSVVIVNIGGKVRRVRYGEQLEGWTLQQVDGRVARFAQGEGQNKELVMQYAAQKGSGNAANSAPGTATQSVNAQPVSPQAPKTQTGEDLVAERRARREAFLRSRGIIK